MLRLTYGPDLSAQAVILNRAGRDDWELVAIKDGAAYLKRAIDPTQARRRLAGEEQVR